MNPVDNTRQPDNDKFKNTFHLACAGSNLTLQTIWLGAYASVIIRRPPFYTFLKLIYELCDAHEEL